MLFIYKFIYIDDLKEKGCHNILTMSHTRINSTSSSSRKSIASSLSDMYYHYEMHINMLKWTGVIVILILSATTLWITCGVYESSKQNTNMTDYIKIDQNFNQSLCSFIKHFSLPSEFVLTICVNYMWIQQENSYRHQTIFKP